MIRLDRRPWLPPGVEWTCPRYRPPSSRLEVKPIVDRSDTRDRPADGQELSIGQVARLTGRRTSSIRYYESLGLLPEPERVGGRRRYGPEVLQLLAVIDACQRAGLSLDEIRELLIAGGAGTPVGDRLRALAERKLPEIDAAIEHAHAIQRWLAAASTCRCVTLHECPLLDPHAAPSRCA